MTTTHLSHALVAAIWVVGCGGSYDTPQHVHQSAPSTSVNPQVVAQQEAVPGGGAVAGNQAPATVNGQLERQIIYDAVVRLIVEDFEGVPEKVDRLLNESGGFVAQAKLHGHSGTPRRGEWKVRIPHGGYSGFLQAARQLGELQSLTADSQDVTEQYYDLESRIRNKQREESRLLKLLEENTGELAEVLKVEHEVSRVREELERMEGRKRVLQDLTALATVTLHVDEIKGYVPPQAPTFAVRVGRAFDGSWQALVATSQSLVVGAVVIGPWAGVFAIPCLGLIWAIRRRARGRRATWLT